LPVLVTEQDFYHVTSANLAKASQQQVRRAELFLGPRKFAESSVPLETILNGVLGAIEDSRLSSTVSAAYILSVHRHRSIDEALQLLDSVAPRSEHIVGVGMGGPEVGYPPGRFKPYYLKTRALGYRTTVHAGEEGRGWRRNAELLRLRPVDWVSCI
jgi:adenosine deaminase